MRKILTMLFAAGLLCSCGQSQQKGVPDEYKADYAEEDVLAELKYSDEPATIHFKAMNYRKGMNTEVQVQYVDLKNPADPVDAEVHLDDNGEATLRLPICFPQVVWPILYTPPTFLRVLFILPRERR